MYLIIFLITLCGLVKNIRIHKYMGAVETHIGKPEKDKKKKKKSNAYILVL